MNLEKKGRIESAQRLIDDLIRTFDGAAVWHIHRLKNTNQPPDATVGAFADIIEGTGFDFVDDSTPLTRGEMFAISLGVDKRSVIGIVFGADWARYFCDLTNLLIRITENLRPMIDEAHGLREAALRLRARGDQIRAEVKATIATHEAMRRAAAAVLEVSRMQPMEESST